jgi:hypothetical protein
MKHRECNPSVSVHPDDSDGEPIHVNFQGHSLCLSEVDASWLASNIERAIRNMNRKIVESATPLTVAQRRQLRIGDCVVVRMDHGHPVGDMVCTVRAQPWQLGNGTWVIGLNEISGGYDLSRVMGIISTTHSRGPGCA